MRNIVFVLVAAVLVLGAAPAPAQDDEQPPLGPGEWRRAGKVGLNLLQSYYTRNWKGGDRGSVVWAATFDYLAEGQLSARWNWRHDLNLAFGQTHQQQRDAQGDLAWESPDKTTDLIRYESLLRYGLSGWDPYFSFRFESQFLDETDPWERSIALNPMTFSEAVGISRSLVDDGDRQLLARLGFSLRQNSRAVFVAPPPDDDKERLSGTDGGFELIFDYRDEILDDRVAYASKLSFYKPVFATAESDLSDLSGDELTAAGLPADVADYALVTDVDWENTFTTAITRLVNVQFYLRWTYDKYDNSVTPLLADDGSLANPVNIDTAIRRAGQLKQTMAIGLAYAF